MRLSVRICGAAVLAAAAVLLLLLPGRAGGLGPSGAEPICPQDYDYAGIQDERPHAGIRATVRMLRIPRVAAGHVAGWLGVGGPGKGPNGTDEWLQIGFDGFQTEELQIYYEVTLPNKPPTYHTVKASLSLNEQHLLSVLEVGGESGHWRVWLDNKAVSPVITLTGSHGHFSPQALGETWNGGTRKCNRYAYGFNAVRVAQTPGGSWMTAKTGYRWENGLNRLIPIAPSSFVARSILGRGATTAVDRPPLLGALASTLAGRPLVASCVRQGVPVRERPAGTLRLSRNVCGTLVGYAVAHPWAPRADGAVGLEVAATALGFLRGVARAAGVGASRVDCRAVERFYRALRVLGATPDQALALRGALLRRRSSVRPRLSFDLSCRFR